MSKDKYYDKAGILLKLLLNTNQSKDIFVISTV